MPRLYGKDSKHPGFEHYLEQSRLAKEADRDRKLLQQRIRLVVKETTANEGPEDALALVHALAALGIVKL